MANMKLGDKVQYRDGDRWKNGVLFAIKKAEAVKGPDIILGYLVDTGKDERLDEIVTDEGKDNILVRQPEQIEVLPDDIRPVK